MNMARTSLSNGGLVVLSVLCSVVMSALVQVTDFGSNPTGLQMYINVPAKLATKPAVILALHGCGGTGPGYAQQTKYNTLSEQYGFITIFPSTPNDSNCWDVASAKSLTHEGGGDTQVLSTMVKYAIQKYDADTSKIFVTGTSSGGMMTNALAATYPDLFAAGSAYSGVAAGCLAGSPGASPISADPACANGNVRKTSEQWVAQVKAMYPTWNGSYPRMQTWHGTADNLVFYPNLAEQIKEWSGIHGVTFSKNNTNIPQSAYTQMVYGDGTELVAYSAQGVGHTVPVHETVDLAWFGIQ